MPSKTKEARQDQKGHWEQKLNQRLAVLAQKGCSPEKISKDATVRKIRAKIRETGSRLKAIENLERKAEEMARAKEEKLAVPKKEKDKKKKDSEGDSKVSKRQQKKMKKKEDKS